MKRVVNLLVVLGIIGMFGVAFIPESVAAMTGSGTEGDPYMIYDVDDLQDIDGDVTALSAYYKLANDIDASETVGWNGGAGFVPIGKTDPTWDFRGSFDGDGYSIINLTINRPSESDVGLFHITENAIIKDVQLESVNITGKSSIGGLAGTLQGEITGCTVTGYITQSTVCCYKSQVGGLAGFIWASIIEDCHTVVVISATEGHIVGGLAGEASGWDTEIVDCSAISTIEGGTFCHNFGGLFGYLSTDSGSVKTSYAQCTITTEGSAVGGFIGEVSGIDNVIQDCYARGEVTITEGEFSYEYNSGGLIGFLDELSDNCTIENCYAAVALSGDGNTGGLIGQDDGIDTSVVASFWDTETSGQATSDGGTGKTTAQMKTESTYASWDFDTIWAISSLINSGYPYLLWGYNPIISDVNQVVWFQPNYIIQGTELPNRTGEEDGVIHWGANPAGITISNGELIPEEEYDFEPIIPGSTDIIKPEPGSMVGDVDLERLHDNPLYPLVQVLTIPGFLTERLVWLGLAWLIVIGAMLGVHLGFDTRRDTEKPQHFILTTIAGLGLSIIFYTMGIFPLWVVILMAFGLVGAIIWERQPVL